MSKRVVRVMVGAVGMALGLFLIAVAVLLFASGPDMVEKAWKGGLFWGFFIISVPICAKFMK